MQTGIPGPHNIYGVHNDGVSTPFAHAGNEPSHAQRLVEDWDTAAYLRHIPRVFEEVRNRFGADLPLLHDAHHRRGIQTRPSTTRLWRPSSSSTTCDSAVTHMGGIAPMRKLFDFATFDDGHLHPGEEPGLGVILDEELAAAHPYQPAYLPVSRLQDGTVHDG